MQARASRRDRSASEFTGLSPYPSRGRKASGVPEQRSRLPIFLVGFSASLWFLVPAVFQPQP